MRSPSVSLVSLCFTLAALGACAGPDLSAVTACPGPDCPGCPGPGCTPQALGKAHV